MGVAILTQHIVNTGQGDVVLDTKGLLERRSAPFIKVSGRIRSDAFKKKKVSLQLHSSNFSLKKLSTTIKTFH